MRDRLKILDCNRKNVLGLPSGAFHLWFTYLMNEDDENESWLSIPEIEAQTGMGRTTIVKWTAFLRKGRWLVDTGKTAEDKLLAMGKVPSGNAHQVHVYRVDDPTSSESELKVYSYDSGSGSGCSSSSGYQSHSDAWPSSTSVSHGRTAEPPAEKQKAEPKPEPTPKSKPVRRAKDGTEFPPDFFSWPDNSKRIDWLCLHDPSFKPIRTLADVQGKRLLKTEQEINQEYSRLMDDLELEDDRDASLFIQLDEQRSVRARGEKPTPKPKRKTKCHTCSDDGVSSLRGRVYCNACFPQAWMEARGKGA